MSERPEDVVRTFLIEAATVQGVHSVGFIQTHDALDSLLVERDALTARIAELERDLAQADKRLDEVVAVVEHRNAELAAERARGERAPTEQMRRDRGWPTPNHMRSMAESLDRMQSAKYGDVLRFVADACDADSAARRALTDSPERPKNPASPFATQADEDAYMATVRPSPEPDEGEGWVQLGRPEPLPEPRGR